MIRKANFNDLEKISEIYENIHTLSENGLSDCCWKRNVYPTEKTASDAIARGDMFVIEDEGEVAGSAIINKIQPEVYAKCTWSENVPEERIMVLHTLTVDPCKGKRGLGRKFLEFYEDYARKDGCLYLRMDTNKNNQTARNFYAKLGYREVGINKCNFSGLPNVELVCLEKKC